MRKIMCLILVITLVLGSASMCFATSEWSWQDDTPYIPNGQETEYSVPQWAKYLEDKYGVFLEDPNRNILRGEFYSILIRSMFNCSERLGYGKMKLDEARDGYKMVYFDDRLEYSEAVQYEILVAAYMDEVLKGTNNKVLFREELTRGEAAKISSWYHFACTWRYMDRYRADREFDDVSINSWHWINVQNAYILGLMNGVDSKNFAPNSNLTLIQALTIIDNETKISQFTNGQKLTDPPDVKKALATVFKMKQ